ncbi:class I SAM-dependent methyltransferase [Streptomyces sp. NPDC021969]|uniref:class I SAM-dependent methyltransferase n=1 Tax=unclassified Streptomyces TaxID=2593676 RepID=UPI0033C4C533
MTAAPDLQITSLKEALDCLLTADDAGRDSAFRALTALVWEGTPTPAAAGAVPLLRDGLAASEGAPAALLAVLLGVLAEPADDLGPAAAAARSEVGEGLDLYLRLLAERRADQAFTQALLYLVAHFPEHRAAVLEVADGLDLAETDHARLRRCLTERDPANPGYGRQWPAPTVWALSDEEASIDAMWMPDVPEEFGVNIFNNDTRMLLGYSGAKALGAIAGPIVGADTETAPEAAPLTGVRPPTGPLGAHADAFACPDCRGVLRVEPGDAAVVCESCDTRFGTDEGYLDMPCSIDMGMIEYMLRDPVHVPRYEDGLRPAFLRVMGRNWDARVTVADEHAYMAEHVAPADGPIVDIAAGAGRWTRLLAELVDPGRVVATDLSGPSLAQLQQALPEVLAVRANALGLPFADGSVGALACWNALQALMDPKAVVAEAGRCLRRGGSFTGLTFRPDADPVYRFFQARHEQALMCRLIDPDELRAWIEEAGMRVVDLSGPGTFLYFSAVKD